MIKFLNGRLTLILIILLGSVLRLYNINFDDLWYDEILSFWVINPQHTLNESFSIHNKLETNTFTFHFLIKPIYYFFDYNFSHIRLISALFGIMSIFLSVKIAKLLNFNQMTNFFAILVALNIFLIGASQEGRVYSILFFFSFLSFIYFVKVYKQGERNKDIFLYFTFTLLSIFLHPFSLIILFSYCTFLIFKYLKTKIFFKKINYCIIGLFVITLFFYLFYIFSLDTTYIRHNWGSLPDLNFYTNFFFSNFFGSRIMGGIFLLSLLILILKEKILIKELNIITVFLISIFLAYFLPILFGYIYKPALHPRYIIFVLIPVLVTISFFSSKISNQKIKYIFVTFLIIVTILNHFTEQSFKQFYNQRVPSKPEYSKAISFISNSEVHQYFVKVENMISEIDSINAINNYISFINNQFPNKLVLINSTQKETIRKPFWQFCPQDINKKACAPDIRRNYEVLIEKNFNNINLKLLEGK